MKDQEPEKYGVMQNQKQQSTEIQSGLVIGSEVTSRYLEAKAALTETYRARVLSYGPDAAKLVLRSFDDLGRLLEES